MPHVSSRPSTRLVAVVLIALVALLGVALWPGGGAPTPAGAAAKTVTINIKDYAYSKKTVTVKRGTKIKWVNKDAMKHDVNSSKKGGPKGPLLAKGKSYTWTARTKGTFNYICTPHPFMKAKIVVR